ncbi:MAG: hypothetical protein WBP41_21065, partial [Saprospiraceae bacterium]
RTSVNRRPTFAFFIARCARNKNYNCLAFKTVVERRFIAFPIVYGWLINQGTALQTPGRRSTDAQLLENYCSLRSQ